MKLNESTPHRWLKKQGRGWISLVLVFSFSISDGIAKREGVSVRRSHETWWWHIDSMGDVKHACLFSIWLKSEQKNRNHSYCFFCIFWYTVSAKYLWVYHDFLLSAGAGLWFPDRCAWSVRMGKYFCTTVMPIVLAEPHFLATQHYTIGETGGLDNILWTIFGRYRSVFLGYTKIHATESAVKLVIKYRVVLHIKRNIWKI